MPRAKSQSRHDLVDNALSAFWNNGYHVLSMNDLVRETGVSRGGIYSDFKGKRELFHACLHRYQEAAVTPGFKQVEAEDAGLPAIRQFLNLRIAQFEELDGPGPGCLVANTLAQLDPDDGETYEYLQTHNNRLTRGFRAVFARENKISGILSEEEVSALAEFTTISIQGLWSYSRKTTDANALRQYAEMLMSLLSAKLRIAEPS